MKNRYDKELFEFDTQTRQEMFNNDTGALPNQMEVTSDPSVNDGHDYRFLQYAYKFMGYDEEPSTKAPFIVESSRRRINESFYRDIAEHNAESEEGEGENPRITINNYEEVGALNQAENEEWLSLSDEEKITEWKRDDYWNLKYLNCRHQTKKSNPETEIGESIIQAEQSEDKKIDIEKIHLLSRGLRRENREHTKLWKKIARENSHLGYRDLVRKFKRELESKKSKSKMVSKRSHQEKRAA